MILNECGLIAYDEWNKLPERFSNVEWGVFQIMPNHMHGIVCIVGDVVGATLAVAPGARLNGAPTNAVAPGARVNRAPTNAVAPGARVNGARVNRAPTVGEIVGAYKSLVANGCLEIFKTENKIMGKLWQRNYYEHIIRDEPSYQRIINYILNNPVTWKEDKFYHS